MDDLDPLTRIPTRPTLLAALNAATHSGSDAADDEKKIAVFYADVDHMTIVNDQVGNEGGDAVLCAVAQVFLKQFGDCCGRYGGDQFAAFAQVASRTDALTVAESVRTTVADMSFEAYPELKVTVRVGLDFWNGDGESAAELMQSADDALYLAKCDGGNCVREAGIQARINSLESGLGARAELRSAMSDLERSRDFALQGIGDALESKDANTESHSKRVTAYTIATARALGLSRARTKTIAYGAWVHDYGKIATPDSLLRKPGTLAPDEIAVLREHSLRGYQMLKDTSLPSETAEIVYAHHECYDGSGYPRGLKGDEIPLGARIVAVADALDSITSKSPYRAARTVEAAREEIRRCSGGQFDPKIVEAFLSVPTSIWEDLRTDLP